MSAPASVYVSCNPKEGPVARYAARGAIIGAIRDAREPKKIAYNPDEVVEIPAAEFVTFQQEYGEALRSGALIKRTKADHDKWIAGEDARSREAYDKRKADEKAAKAARLEKEARERAARERAAAVAMAAPEAAAGSLEPSDEEAPEQGAPTESES